MSEINSENDGFDDENEGKMKENNEEDDDFVNDLNDVLGKTRFEEILEIVKRIEETKMIKECDKIDIIASVLNSSKLSKMSIKAIKDEVKSVNRVKLSKALTNKRYYDKRRKDK